jgi:DNA-binding CsgD family transcriptional regulator
MKNLKYLNKLTKKEREAIKNRKTYEKRLEETGEKPKAEKVKIRRAEIAKMLSEGKTEKEIITTLEISRRTYYSDKAVIIAQGLAKRAVRAIREVRKAANKITRSITNTLKEIYDTIKEMDLESDILKQIKKVRIKC